MRTPEGKIVLFHGETGERFERWPVDAREMLACGAYTTDDPTGTESDASAVTDTPTGEPDPDPLPHVTQAAALNGAVSPTGAPLIVSPASGVTPAAPVQLPAGRAPRRGR
jgi:hypothetical protein